MRSRASFDRFNKLGSFVNNLAKPIFAENGFSNIKIITEWENIVGKEIANFATPISINYIDNNESKQATLAVEVANSSIASKLYFMEPMILDKIAVFFGYKAISKLKIKHSNFKKIKEEEIPPVHLTFSQEKENKLNMMLENIEDETLKTLLYGIGKEVLSR